MPEQAENRICGDCKFFDPNYKYGRGPVGTSSWRTGKPVTQGFCRAEEADPNARWLGIVNPDSQCRQPDDVIKKIFAVEPPPAA
jgi:hypothetical protein